MDISLIVGLGFVIIFAIFISAFKNKKIYYSLLTISLVLSALRISYGNNWGVVVGMDNVNTADCLFPPLIYLLLFQILRLMYLEFYKREPAFGGSRFFNFDVTENRKLDLADNAVEFVPLIVAILLPYIIAKITHG